MARPTLTRSKRPLERLDGAVGVEYQFDAQGDVSTYRDTLWDDWHTKPVAEQTAEMNRRYDEWRSIVSTPPAEPTIVELEELRLDKEAQIRQLQREILDVDDQIAAMKRAAPAEE